MKTRQNGIIYVRVKCITTISRQPHHQTDIHINRLDFFRLTTENRSTMSKENLAPVRCESSCADHRESERFLQSKHMKLSMILL